MDIKTGYSIHTCEVMIGRDEGNRRIQTNPATMSYPFPTKSPGFFLTSLDTLALGSKYLPKDH